MIKLRKKKDAGFTNNPVCRFRQEDTGLKKENNQ